MFDNDKDFLGLKKLEQDLNKSLNFDIFDKPKSKRKTKAQKFPQPKPKYTKKKDYSQDIEMTKKFVKETGSAFGKIISNIKNRKIRKLEKLALKQQHKAQALAHKVKTLNVLQDSLIDIARYEKEVLKIQQEINEQSAQMQDKTNEELENTNPDQGCPRHAKSFNPKCSNCLEWAENLE